MHSLLLILALLGALAFEFVNGFHDTANAVATVIYTRSLRSHWAVLFSGLLNFAGVMLAGVGVAYSIVHLFPLDALSSTGALAGHGLAMIFAVLGAAMIWNLGTWFVGIPASSSHALIGSILGASMGFCIQQGIPLQEGVAWDKARQITAALLISPLFGFLCAYLMLRLMRRFCTDPKLFQAPQGEAPPPWWIRMLLIATCGGVSFAHGSNDGQKGMGLVMLILIGLAPATYALNLQARPELNQRASVACRRMAELLPEGPARLPVSQELQAYLRGTAVPSGLRLSLQQSAQVWSQDLSNLPADERIAFRNLTGLQARCLRKLADQGGPQAQEMRQAARDLEAPIEYVSDWVKLAVALALGLGTMVGWKRIVVTVGEKIGKDQLNYGQGAAAQLVAASTILLADVMKMPVSTTHVLSSGVAGAMSAQKCALQRRTLLSIGLAWVLTLPACITLALGLYLGLS
ncbi:inorganic phosphate transporter [bacterium]|nr:inorganic phosphate transporter [bacterium]